MTLDRDAFRRLEALFHRLAAAAEDERRAELETLHRGEPELHAELLRLLEADRTRAADAIAGGMIRLLPSPSSSPSPAMPAVPEIEGFEIVRQIGEGGMGVVYEAEQRTPVRRTVALKVVRSGLGSAEVLARFEAERQTLALMEHPHIARVFEVGATVDGRPFFAMELVRGEPITSFCDRHRMTTEDRLALFVDVCDAVQHAHRKGVLHRDLKPSNVLVAQRDGQPMVKVIDFGIAKAIDLDALEREAFTRHGQLVGTPEYMSPEQAGLESGGVDTRSDVFSLGIVLHELLVGEVPLSAASLRGAGLDEIRRRIRETTAARPSSRLEPVTDAVRTVASSRRTDPVALRRRLRGDLDWVVLRAVARERDERYGAVSELADDIRRHLRHEPVVAGPPGVGYRVRKFMRRHRLGVGVAAAAVVALVMGSAIAVWGLMEARQAQRRAELEAAAATWVSDFLVELFDVSDPRQSAVHDLTARDLLDRGMARIAADPDHAEPALLSRLREAMGRAYTGLGDAPTAVEILAANLASLRATATASPAREAEALRLLALAEGEDGRSEAAVGHLREAVALLRRAGPAGELRVATVEVTLAAHLVDLAQLDEAATLFERALEVHRRRAPASREMALLLNNYCILEKERQHLDRAAQLCREALALKEQLDGPAALSLAASLNNLAVITRLAGDPAAARPLLERSLAIRQRHLEPDHPTIAEALNNLGGVAIQQGDLAAARSYYEESLAIRERVLSPDHPKISQSYYNLACVAHELGDERAVVRYFVTAVERGLAHPAVFDSSCLGAVRGDPAVERGIATVRARLAAREGAAARSQ